MSGKHYMSSWLNYPKSAPPSHTTGEFLASLNNERWMDRAACAGTDPEAWFPDRGSHSSGTKTAVRLCRQRCEVAKECLIYALRSEEELIGVWGGTTQHERRELRAKRETA